MMKKRLSILLAFVFSFLIINVLHAEVRISAEDFLPPVQAKTSGEAAQLLQVKQPEKVEVSEDKASGETVVRAETASDAFNSVVDTKKVGCVRAEFGSGFGWVATGMGTYERMEDVVASRISKRNAYIVAYMMAKKELAQALSELSTEGKSRVREQMLLVSKADDSLKSIESESAETLEQTVRKLLKGFVLYSVLDDEENTSVFVSIVSTPRTRGRFNRVELDSIDAASLQEGLNQVLAELNSGLTPPVGNKMITVPATGEVAFIGFGSSVVRIDENQAVNARLLLQAERVADMRAADALCGVIVGDQTSWRGKLDERTTSMLADFEVAQKGDPISFTEDGTAYTELQKRKTSFINSLKESQQYESIRQGILPPGVIRRAWTDEQSGFSYAVAVYLPSATAEARKDSAEMDEVDLLAPVPDKGTPRQKGPAEGEVKKGPSGKIHDEKSL
jgi:hypothetical protein